MLPPQSAQPGAMSCVVCGLNADPRAPAFLIECHFCGRWLHGACAQISEQDALLVAKFACVDCQHHGHDGVKYERNENAFDANAMAFSPLLVHLGGYAASSTPVQLRHKKSSSGFRRLLGAAMYARSGVHLVPFHDVQPSFLQRHALEEPVLIAGNSHRAAGLEEPFPVLDAAAIADLLTGDREVRTIDVATQTRQQLTAPAWQATTTESNQQNEEETALLGNAEFQLQQTPMQLKVAAPIAVTQVNWSCLMESNNGEENSRGNATNGNIFGAFLEANAFLDFALAPGGQCTWLSVSAGELWVYLIPPTSAAFDAYRDWKSDPDFATAFLAERVEKCIKCVVSAGSTLLVPAGWTFARYAGGVQSCSLFHGFFTCTSAMEAQLEVVMLEMQHDALAEYWRETSSGWLKVDANVQLWTAVCYYVHQLLMANNGMNAQVSDLDRRALQRAFPRLRDWSALPASLKSVNGITWTPSSQREAQAIVGRLEQALAATCLPTHNLDDLQPTSGLGNDSKLPPISPNEATYIYSAASVPDSVSFPWGSASNRFDSTSTTNFSSSAPMWSNYDPLQQHQHHQPDHLVISTQNQPYPNNDPSFQQHSPNQNLPEYGAEYGYLSGGMSEGFMATSGQHNLGLEGLGSLGGVASHALSNSLTPSVPATGFQQPRLDNNGNYVDMLMRHRASCHRCGNLRKKNVRCPVCPHIFCAKCAEKMIEEHGDRIFENGCPVCKELCCCGKNRTTNCTRKFHCYKKCPSTKRPASG